MLSDPSSVFVPSSGLYSVDETVSSNNAVLEGKRQV